MANLREAFDYASKNPNSDFAKNLKTLTESGSLNVEAKKYGIDLSPFQQPKISGPQVQTAMQEKPKASVPEKILQFTGGDTLAKGLGQGIANVAGNNQMLEETQKGQGEQQTKLIAAIRKNKSEGKDTSRLEKALADLTGGIIDTGAGAEGLLNPNQITGKQIAGDALQLATTVAGVGSYGNATAQTGKLFASKVPSIATNLTKTTGLIKGAATGLVKGAAEGTAIGASAGVSQGLKNDDSAGEIATKGIIGGVSGGVLSGIIGTITGGVSGIIKSNKLRTSILDAQEQQGLRPSLTEKIKEKVTTDPKFGFMVKEAKKQGFGDSEINFLSSVSKKDKPVFQKMYDLTVKAQSDPRQIIRAGDVLGENVTQQVKQVINLNKQAGKAVDLAAKSLKGQTVDAEPLAQKILSKLEDSGVIMDQDGNLDFSGSVFKNTPSIQKEIQKVILSVPDGSDAYQFHIFKKSLDEMLDYGTSGEGLKGSAANILKSFRASADEILDNTFQDYNQANSAFKLTRDYIDQAKGMVGKKVDLSSNEGAQAFGQALRSAFSNNKSRPNTLKFIEDTHLLSKELGLTGSEKNLLDQALFVNMLEETFGSEAATGLAGEVSKAINNVKTAANIVRNPVSGALGVAGDLIEKAQKISPEAKKQILKAFIK